MISSRFRNYHVVLASKSPRRQQLLEGMNISFTTLLKEVDESYPAMLPVGEISGYLSKKKAMAFTIDELPESFLLITADTIVVIDNEVLNKPLDRNEAIRMLTRLSGNHHKVITGVSIRDEQSMVTFSEESDVKFVNLTPEEIEYYVDEYQPFDKAGSYGIQEWIGYIAIESVNGSFFNVMGLPTHRLYLEMMNFVNRGVII
jgi:septum formation protein